MNVIELFAGVGGFRVGLDRVNDQLHKSFFNTIWSNQFEPATKTQHASQAYKNLKKKCRHTDSQDGTPELSNRQKQLNDAFEKMLENEKCNK